VGYPSVGDPSLNLELELHSTVLHTHRYICIYPQHMFVI
jgi:hypothetical protein